MRRCVGRLRVVVVVETRATGTIGRLEPVMLESRVLKVGTKVNSAIDAKKAPTFLLNFSCSPKIFDSFHLLL